MVFVDVGVAEGMDEVAGLVAGNVGEDEREEGVTGNIEWHAEEEVGGALVELEGEFVAGDVDVK